MEGLPTVWTSMDAATDAHAANARRHTTNLLRLRTYNLMRHTLLPGRTRRFALSLMYMPYGLRIRD